ncbi:SurA N-terminal domain-containing protein [Bacillus dakarensis]|uniref:SurA N-terminal domain-containing protein n=1 Tax=Robertmurraya dakarensis TaxID=1926278 RepID=UPI0009813072|nr:SurA N-terminal domain-containing protein [Bacillus dakarensis]
MFKRISTGFILLFSALFLLGACSSEGSETEKTEEAGGVVATVNGEEILKKDYDNRLKATKNSYAQQGINVDELDSKTKENLEKSVLDQLINQELLLQTAKTEGVAVQPSEIDTEIDQLKSQFEDDKKFQEALKENNLTEETLKQQTQEQLLINKYIDHTIGDITVSEEEIKSIYEQYKKQAESQGQELPDHDFETIKPQMEQEAIAQKKNEKVGELLENLRKSNEENIKVLG